MARESQTQTIKKWLDRIETAKRWRDRKAEEYGWERFIKEYMGIYDVTLGRGKRGNRVKAPAVNEVFAFVQTDVATINFKDPYITVRPTKTATAKGATILESAVNYYWRTLNVKEEIDSQLVDADLVGHAWNKDGYFAESVGDGETAQIKREGMYSMKVSWRDIVFNVGSRRPPMDCQWMAHRIIRPLDEVKERYPGTGELKGAVHPHLQELDYRETQYKDDIEYVSLWEVWDASNRKFFLLAENHEAYLKKPMPWPDYYRSFPFNMLWWYEMPDDPYPMSPIAPQEPQILEQIKLFAQALNHVKRWNRQMIIKGGTMSEESADKFEEGIDGAIIQADTQGSIQDSIRFADFGQLPTDIYVLLDRLKQTQRMVTGQPEFQQGALTKTATRTLGELEQMAQGAKTRQDRRVDRLETHIESIARNMIAHMQANFDVEQMVKITGETPQAVAEALGEHFDPETQTIVFSKNDIGGEYEVEVRAGSTLPMTKSTRMAVLRETLEIALNAKGPLSPFSRLVIGELLADFQLPELKTAFEVEQEKAERAMAESGGKLSLEGGKIAAETAKRQAQAEQIGLENAAMVAQLRTPLEALQAVESGQSVDQEPMEAMQ